MKKLLSLLVLTFLLFTSCNKSDNTSQANAKHKNGTSNKYTSNTSDLNNNIEKHTIKDYYPFRKNIRLKYKGEGNEFAEKSVYTDYIQNNRIQLRIVNHGTTTAQILEIKDGELRLIKSIEEFYYRDNLTGIKNDNYEILLKEPLVPGTSWEISNGNKRYISNVNKDIETPSGHYKALEVTTEGKNSKNIDYYVLDKGLVQSIYKGANMEVKSTLEEVDKTVPVIQTVKFYYPDYINAKTIYVKNKLSFNTNDTLISSLERYFKEAPGKEIVPLMGKNSKINEVSLDRKENIVKIDFSGDFVKNLNLGSGPEIEVLKSITNTLCDYYNVNRAYLTLEGKPYSSGHISLEEGETFKFDLNDVEEYR